MIDLADLAIFVEAVNAGSLAGAARRLQIPAMTASRRLAALEAELGVRLVHRTTRHLSLTGEGEALLPRAQALIEAEQALREEARPAPGAISGVLRVAASATFGRRVLTEFVGGFLKKNPAVKVELLLQDQIADIVDQGVDCAIRIGILQDSAMIAQAIADNPRALYASPTYLDRAGRPEAMRDLARHECLVQPGTTQWRFGPRQIGQRVGGAFSANSMEALHEAAVQGMGIALLSEWAARDDVAAGRLEPIALAEGQPEPFRIWAVYPTTRFVPPKVRQFIAALREHLA